MDTKKSKQFIEWMLPIPTVSEANRTSEHWTKKSKRHRMQKILIKFAFLEHKDPIELPVHIKLIRLSPRFLDVDENLPCAFKYIKDYIADQLVPGLKAGRADEDTRLTWSFGQEKGPMGIKIQFIPPVDDSY